MSLWVPVVAALGASLLTSLGAWGLEALRQRDARAGRAGDLRHAAYVAFAQSANGMLMTGQMLRALLQLRSGLASSMAEALRLRRPIDPVELLWRMKGELQPILDAQSALLACGTPAAAAASRVVAEAAASYLRAATAMTGRQRRWLGLVKLQPNAEQEQEASTRLTEVGDAVRAFLAVVRDDLGQDALPTIIEASPAPDTVVQQDS